MRSESFEVSVSFKDVQDFARLSGDWNPLHTDPSYAAQTTFEKPILHGAFSAGLVSKMAGMHIPGEDCLLHGIRLRFITPIIPPVRLKVVGRQTAEGRVEVQISDKETGTRYVDASYDYSHHRVTEIVEIKERENNLVDGKILVTGATGGLGSALLDQIGDLAIGVSRKERPGMLQVEALEEIDQVIGDTKISAIVHCAWPMPDNDALTGTSDLHQTVENHVAKPLRQMMALARVLKRNGQDNAPLILVGSTFAQSGRHNYRMPLYSLSKSIVPELTKILALELGSSGMRCISVVFDVITGGMNKGISELALVSHADRNPTGTLASIQDAARQITWVLENNSQLVSGASITLSGGSLP
jgi:NAD(P)-dependent dehydrogenase (short-subunit alcohol dehydrogenase family)